VLTLTANTGSFKIGDIDGLGNEAYIEGDSSSIKVFTGGGETLFCNSNQRVGIGTTNPGSKLTVRDGTSNTSAEILTYNGASGTEAALKFSTIGSETNFKKAAIIVKNAAGSWGRNDMHFALDSAADNSNVQFSDTKMTILNGGNVGIGTTSPSHKLEVGLTSNVALASQPAIPLMVSNNGYNVDGRVFIQVKNDVVNAASAVGAGFQMTAAGVTSGTASFENSLIFLESKSPGNQTIHSAPQNIKFYVDNDGTSAGAGVNYSDLGDLSFELQSDGDGIFYHNVGINTTNPSYKLQVTGGQGDTLFFQVDEDEDAYLQIKPDAATTFKIGDINGRTSQMEITGDATTLKFNGSGTNIMTITDDELVGIGTDNPSELLHLSSTGPARLLIEADTDNVTETDNAQIILKQDGGAVVGRLGYRTNTNDLELLNEYTSNIYLGTSNSIRATINANGNFGIGTPGPGAKTHILNGIAQNGLIVENSTSSFTSSAIYANNTSTTNGNLLRLRSSGSDRVIVSGQGNVGINTTNTTQAKLHITVPDYYGGCKITGPASGTTFYYMGFYSGTSYRGNILPSLTGVNYNSASDYRLKENVIKLQNSTERIKKLKPSNFNFLENPSETVDGFIAHEVQEVVPEAVTGEKDAVGRDGRPEYQGIDQSKIVPLLTAALQEAISKIEQLETRIQKLENK